ncbi:MAG: hypothetical protein JRH06_17080 [Deltaproteobacteria bacterium]|nr:hypothetical protein [Deltaproteobacteria bacterium]MBW2139249.1 hypothetical protein [Deltaproteobacteria bacterium]
MKEITIGILCPGDMGHSIGKVLVSNGLTVITCLEGRSERTKTLARKAGIEDVPSCQSLVKEAGIIL